MTKLRQRPIAVHSRTLLRDFARAWYWLPGWGLHRIQEYAHAGLPIILSGGDPGAYAALEGRDRPDLETAILSLKQTHSVYSIPTEQVSAKLQALGLQPQVNVKSNGTWYSTWCEDAQHGMFHAFVFCESHASWGTVDIASSKVPFFLNELQASSSPCSSTNVMEAGLQSLLPWQPTRVSSLASPTVLTPRCMSQSRSPMCSAMTIPKILAQSYMSRRTRTAGL